ncbi:MAG: ABC transporter permease [Fimbriimonadaceae bacterium]|nr:ABC transporter permease [Fimbriimonadaceae bacterium]
MRGILFLALTWVIVFVLFGFLVENGRFLTLGNFETILRQSTVVGFAAIGMTFIIISAAIDLSVGSMVAFVTVAIAYFLDRMGMPVLLAGVAGIGAGAAWGFFNGQIVTRLKLSPFIVTLGSFLMIRGFAKWLAGNQKIDAPLTWIGSLTQQLKPSQKWMLVPYGVWMLIAAAVIATIILERTVFGRNVVAVGSNEEAARLSGINPSRVRAWVFTLGGMFTGFAGLMLFSRLTVGDPTVGAGLELEAIAAVVIGGASLSGGEGTIWGSLIGALIMATIRSGCSMMGWDNYVQEIITGAIIVVAVALDRMRHARALKAA